MLDYKATVKLLIGTLSDTAFQTTQSPTSRSQSHEEHAEKVRKTLLKEKATGATKLAYVMQLLLLTRHRLISSPVRGGYNVIKRYTERGTERNTERNTEREYVLRTNVTGATTHLAEIHKEISACYCLGQLEIAPKLVAAVVYTLKGQFRDREDDAFHYITVMEGYKGDVESGLRNEKNADRAGKLMDATADVLKKASEHGVVQIDSKPANCVYRHVKEDEFTVRLIDFDFRFTVFSRVHLHPKLPHLVNFALTLVTSIGLCNFDNLDDKTSALFEWFEAHLFAKSGLERKDLVELFHTYSDAGLEDIEGELTTQGETSLVKTLHRHFAAAEGLGSATRPAFRTVMYVMGVFTGDTDGRDQDYGRSVTIAGQIYEWNAVWPLRYEDEDTDGSESEASASKSPVSAALVLQRMALTLIKLFCPDDWHSR